MEITIVLAHRGWDELMLFAVPVIVLYLGMRWWDDRQEGADDAADEPDDA